MRISDWSSDVCSSDLMPEAGNRRTATGVEKASSLRIDGVDAVTGDRDRIIRGQAAVEHAARLGTHGGSPDGPINAAGQSSSGYAKWQKRRHADRMRRCRDRRGRLRRDELEGPYPRSTGLSEAGHPVLRYLDAARECRRLALHRRPPRGGAAAGEARSEEHTSELQS